MNIEVSKLFHHPLNQEIYSLSEIDDLSLSIDDVGLLQPLVINQHNQVISGNRRFVAIQRLGWDKVDVSQVNINEEDTGKYLVHYNKFRQKTFREILNEYNVLLDHYNRELGRPKKGVLQNTIKGKSRDLISDEINISSSQIGKLLVIQKEDDSLITLIDEGILTIGQAYIQISRMRKEREIRSNKEITILSTNNHRFHHKSSSDMFELEDGEVQLVFTSPPYWNKRKYSNEEGWLGNENTPEEYINNIINHFNDTHRVLNDKGSFFLNIGDTFKDGIENTEFIFGGRMYGPWIDYSSEVRRRIRINGGSTTELDRKAPHLNAMYQVITGKLCSYDDAYDLTIGGIKVPRHIAKNFCSFMQGSSSPRGTAQRVINHYKYKARG